MRFWRLTFLFLLILVLIFSGCSKPKPQPVNNAKLKIICTILPYKLITQQIVGDKATVTTFIPANASPHTYSPTPREVKQFYDADLVIANGLSLEANMVSFLTELGGKTLFVSDFVPEMMLTQDVDEHAGFNPHIWTNPDMIVLIAQGIELKLEELSPQNSPEFRKNLEQLKKEVAAASSKIETERSKYGVVGIITFHDSFKYFNEKYNIELVGAVESSPGKEPSPRELADLGEKIRQYKVHTIFIEPEFNPKSAEVIAKEYGLSVLKYDPIGTTLNVKTISEFLLKNWDLLKKGF
ncbi:MAG TPA: metal ABC transporter substrate-binding protein [Candidatus Cloacimonadota bacterium]|nr:metal ABC transporter substrate-binding protein [Candidatus Cloacimonadota bacterium]